MIHDMTTDAYLNSTDHISNSLMNLFRKDRLAFKKQFVDGIYTENERTSSTDLGDWVHEAVLEIGRFADRLVVIPQEVLSKSGARAGKAWKEYAADPANKGKLLLRAKELDHVMEMRKGVMSHPRAKELVEANGFFEATVLWTCDNTGLKRRVRYDKLIPGHGWLDLKTSRDIRPRSFMESILAYHYDTQAAFYQDAYVHTYKHEGEFTIIAVDNCKPVDPPCECYALAAADWERAADTVHRTLTEIKQCIYHNEWPDTEQPDF